MLGHALIPGIPLRPRGGVRRSRRRPRGRPRRMDRDLPRRRDSERHHAAADALPDRASGVAARVAGARVPDRAAGTPNPRRRSASHRHRRRHRALPTTPRDASGGQQGTGRRGAKPLAGLTRRNLVRELIAGVTLLAIAIPLNIGYAQIAGLPPTAGLYALIVPTVVYALVVSSRQLVASPDAAAAALVASSIGGLAVAGSADYATLALAQAIICGVMFVLLAVFKLGFLANFLSKPILVGFVGGLALDILVSQVAKMLGVSIDSGGEFVDKVVGLVTGLNTLNWWSVAISVVAVGGAPRRSQVPRASCRGRSSCWCSPPSPSWSRTSTTPASPCSARCRRARRRSPGRSSTGRCGSRSSRRRSRSPW